MLVQEYLQLYRRAPVVGYWVTIAFIGEKTGKVVDELARRRMLNASPFGRCERREHVCLERCSFVEVIIPIECFIRSFVAMFTFVTIFTTGVDSRMHVGANFVCEQMHHARFIGYSATFTIGKSGRWCKQTGDKTENKYFFMRDSYG